jgi:hypothetical protein
MRFFASRLVLLPLAALLQCGGKVQPRTDHAVVLSRVTGPAGTMSTCPEGLNLPSTNDTLRRWNVGGTDLGIAWENGRGEVAIVFGDTYQHGDTDDPATFHLDPRRNVIGFTTDREPGDGLTITRMVEDRPGHAAEIIGATPGIGEEQSVIPTAGIASGGRSFLFFMSVARWKVGPGWVTNYSSVAYSDDGGETWSRSDARWPGDSKFAQAGLALDGGYLYVFGTPAARRGALHVARVLPEDALSPPRYEYFTASGWQSGDEMRAIPIVPAPLGEMSIHRNAGSGLWQLTYLDVLRAAIVMRTARVLTGPWSEATVLVEQSDAEHPGMYGGFQYPWFNDGPDVHLTLSKRRPCYEAFLARIPAPLARGGASE